jgi:hypothetical protein
MTSTTPVGLPQKAAHRETILQLSVFIGSYLRANFSSAEVCPQSLVLSIRPVPALYSRLHPLRLSCKGNNMNPRRNQRFPFSGKVTLSWEQGSDYAMARGTCLDISQNGLCIKIKEPIPVGSYVGLSIDPLGFRSSASVRHIVRGVAHFTVGLELSQPAPARALTVQ